MPAAADPASVSADPHRGWRTHAARLAGREADIAAIWVNTTFEEAREKVDRVRAAAGGRFPFIELSTLLDVVLTDDREQRIADLAKLGEVPHEHVAALVARPVGTVDDVRAHILRLASEVGITYFTLRGPHVDELAPLVRELTGITI